MPLKLGLFVRLEAKPGKEKEVAAFLKKGLQLANHEPSTPLWFVALLASAWPIYRVWRDRQRRRRSREGLCPACGYNARATPERCPECGVAIPNKESALTATAAE
jgi:hypothetical protein